MNTYYIYQSIDTKNIKLQNFLLFLFSERNSLGSNNEPRYNLAGKMSKESSAVPPAGSGNNQLPPSTASERRMAKYKEERRRQLANQIANRLSSNQSSSSSDENDDNSSTLDKYAKYRRHHRSKPNIPQVCISYKYIRTCFSTNFNISRRLSGLCLWAL